ncbi:hypothetical protein WUBG_12980, partial [Wuchereria bancrofti]
VVLWIRHQWFIFVYNTYEVTLPQCVWNFMQHFLDMQLAIYICALHVVYHRVSPKISNTVVIRVIFGSINRRSSEWAILWVTFCAFLCGP